MAYKNIMKYMPLLRSYLSSVDNEYRVFFVTLTLKNRSYYSPQEIRAYYQKLALQYKRADKFKAGLYVIETKQEGRGWHTHIHAIWLSKKVSKSKLSQRWLKITGDSYIVDFQEAQSIYHLKKYLLSYVSKKMQFNTKEDADTFLAVSKHQKLLQTHGDRYGFFVSVFKYLCPECSSDNWFYDRDLYGLEPVQSYLSSSTSNKLLAWT